MLTQDPMSIMAKASRLTIPQLQQAIRNGTIPRDIGAIVLSQKIKEQQAAKQAQAMQQPMQPPVAQQAMAYQDPGITAMPSNLPVYSAAQGGIVAFAGDEGSYVNDFSAPGMSEQDEAYARAMQNSFISADSPVMNTLFPHKTIANTLGGGIDAIWGQTLVADPDGPPGKVITRAELARRQAANKASVNKFEEEIKAGRKERQDYVAKQEKQRQAEPTLGSTLSRQDKTAAFLAKEKPNEAQIMAGNAAARLRAGDYPQPEVVPTPMIGADRTTYSGGTASRGKGIDSLLKGYNVAKFDDTELRNMMAGENNPETGKPYTYEELAARNKERGIAAGVDYDTYKKQMEELEGKKQPSERRRKMDEAAPWFALSKSLAEAKPGEGWATSLGRGLSSYGESKGQITEKEEARLEGIRKEANQLALAQNAFVQAEMAGNKADMKAAQDRINAIRMKMSDMGVESTKEQNKAAADVFKAKASMEETLIRERGAWGRTAMERNQINQLANMLIQDANKAGKPITQSEAMAEAYRIAKFQGSIIGAEGRAEKDKQALYQKYVDSFRKDLKNYGKNPLEYSDWLATSSFGTGAGGSFSSSGNPDIDAIMKRNMPK